MKPHFAFLAAILLSGFALVHAEDAATSAPESSSPNPPVQTGTAAQLLPVQDMVPAAPMIAKPVEAPVPAAPKPPKKGTAEQLRQDIQIRELKTVVLEDPAVQAQKAMADCAKTEEGRRVLMRNYYTLLYTKIEQLNPVLTPVLEPQLHNILVTYEQHQVCPSPLIEPVVALPGSSSADHACPSDADTAKPKKEGKKKNKLFGF